MKKDISVWVNPEHIDGREVILVSKDKHHNSVSASLVIHFPEPKEFTREQVARAVGSAVASMLNVSNPDLAREMGMKAVEV